MAVQDPSATAEFEESDRNLRKSVGFTHLLFICISSIIGSGWLFASLGAASVAGPAAIVSWVIGGVLVLLIAVNYAEIGAMLPRSGGLARYTELTHGRFAGWLMGWIYFIASVTVPAIEAEAVVTYVGSQTDIGLMRSSHGKHILAWPNGVLFAIALMILFFLVNYFGVRLLVELNKWVTWWKLIVPTLTAIFLFTIVDSTNYHGYGGFMPQGSSSIFFAISSTGIMFAYLGFRQAIDFAGEAKNPQRHVPLAIIGSVLICMALYVLLQVGFLGAIDWHAAGVRPGDWTGLASSSWSDGPLVDALRAAGIGWLGAWAWVLLVDAGISPAGTGWVYTGVTTRIVYGLSVHRFLPKSLQATNRFAIPWRAVIISVVVGVLFMYPAPSWYKMVGIITSATALTFMMGGLSLPVFRKYAPALHRPFRMPWQWLLAPLGYLASILAMYWGGYETLIDLIAGSFLGLPVFGWYYARAHDWFPNRTAALASDVAGVIYLAVWVYIQVMGGWVARLTPPADGSWGFVVYFVTMCADVAFLWIATVLCVRGENRHDVLRASWLLVLLLAILPISYYGAFGPAKHPAIAFPWDTLVVIAGGMVLFAWSVLSGYDTPRMQQITAAARVGAPAADPPVAE